MKKVILFFLMVVSFEAQAVMVLPLNTTQMTQQAGKIFIGRCIENSIGLDENDLPSTLVKFSVLSGFKGVEEGEEVLVKQFGVTRKSLDVAEGESVVVPMKSMSIAPQSYEVGQEYLLFFYPESQLGFTSPIGAGQGKFQILTDVNGEQLVINPFENKFLKEFVRKKNKSGPIKLQEMKETVERLVLDTNAP